LPEKLVWTEQRDTWLKRLRAEGMAWDAIAAALGISRNAAIERGRRIGARLPPPEHRPEPEDPDRPPMPPGHPTSWGAIVTGTCLEDTPYPLPSPWAVRAPDGAQPSPPKPAAEMPLAVAPDRARAALRLRDYGPEPAAAG
jgi:hypothetical protein